MQQVILFCFCIEVAGVTANQVYHQSYNRAEDRMVTNKRTVKKQLTVDDVCKILQGLMSELI
jgi:hypothetical protein